LTVQAEGFIIKKNKIYLNIMRKSILTLIIFVVANSIFAQEDKNLIEAQKKAVLDAITKTDQNVLKTPTKPKPWLERAIAYLDLASFPDSTVSLKDPEASFKALDYISEAIKLDTRDGEKGAIAKEAEVLITGNNTSKAYSAFMNMTVIKYTNQDYLNSFKYINKAYEISPNDTITAFWKGAIAVYCNKYSDAKEAFEKYIKYGGSDINAMYTLSQLYILDKEDSKSNEIKSKAIAIYGFIKWEKQENKTDAEPRKGKSTEIVKENVSPKKEEKVIIVEQEKEIKKENEKIITNYPVEPDEVKKIKEKMLEITGFKIEPTKYWTSYVDFRKNYILKPNLLFNLTNSVSYDYKEFLKTKNEGQEVVIYKKTNGKIILIRNNTKEKIINLEFESAIKEGYNTWRVSNSSGQLGIINDKGEILIPIVFTKIEVLDGYTDSEILEPQIFKCETSNYHYNGIDFNSPKPFICKVINRKGEILASTNGEVEKIDLEYFINNGKVFTVFKFKKVKDEKVIGNEFSICEYGELPNKRYNGEFNIWPHLDEDLKDFLWTINPLFIPVSFGYTSFYATDPLKQKGSLKVFDLTKLEFVKEIPEFVGLEMTGKYSNDEIILVNNKNFHTVISNKLKTSIPFVPFRIQGNVFDVITNPMGSRNNMELDSLYLISDLKNNNKGIITKDNRVILETKHKELIAISNRYFVVENLDETFNVFDAKKRKMVLSQNFERIGIKKDPNDNLDFQLNLEKFTNFVDCIFEGKTERISLPK
jgi:tetratricopeptide (TPR) repeat protein